MLPHLHTFLTLMIDVMGYTQKGFLPALHKMAEYLIVFMVILFIHLLINYYL